MRKFLSLMVCALLLASCGALSHTPQERAAQKAAEEEMVKTALENQNFRINVTSVTPLLAGSRSISGFWMKVESTHVQCFLPYIGRDDILHKKTPGEMRMDSKLEFSSPIEDYLHQYNPETNTRLITFNTLYRGEEYKFNLLVEHTDEARIRVIPESRDEIVYEGRVQLP